MTSALPREAPAPSSAKTSACRPDHTVTGQAIAIETAPDASSLAFAACHRPVFPPVARLHNPPQFKLVFAEGRRLKRVPIGLSYRVNELRHARLGLAIAKKAVADAHDRNRIKRLIREEFRHNRARLPAVDLVFFAQSGLAELSNVAIRALLADIWTLVIERCARSSSAPSAPTSGR